MIDWQALGQETVDLLRRDGIASETVESAPGGGNLAARLRGDGSLGGIVLHHHIDVVYADRKSVV